MDGFPYDLKLKEQEALSKKEEEVIAKLYHLVIYS